MSVTSAPSMTSPASSAAARPVSARTLWLIATLLLMPFPVILHDFSQSTRSYDYLTLIFPVDVGLAALVLASARPLIRDVRHRRWDAGWTGWLIVTALLTIAWMAHPSQRGVHTLLELYGVVAIAHTLARTEDQESRRAILATIASIAVLETLWAVAQRIHHAPIGLHRLGESSDPFYHAFGRGALAAQGSMVHIYVLAGLGLVAGALLGAAAIRERRAGWAIAAGLAAATVGMTYSRAGALGIALLVVAVGAAAVIPARRRWSLIAVGALVIGAAVPALVWANGWTARAGQTTSAGSRESLTTNRGQLQRQAEDLIRASPLVGVGPGRYLPALSQRVATNPGAKRPILKPVHNVPLLVAAEGGVLAGAVLTAALVLLGWRAVRSGPLGVGLFLALLPFFLLDHFAYSFPQGVVLTGVWLGALDAAYRGSPSRRHNRATRSLPDRALALTDLA